MAARPWGDPRRTLGEGGGQMSWVGLVHCPKGGWLVTPSVHTADVKCLLEVWSQSGPRNTTSSIPRVTPGSVIPQGLRTQHAVLPTAKADHSRWTPSKIRAGESRESLHAARCELPQPSPGAVIRGDCIHPRPTMSRENVCKVSSTREAHSTPRVCIRSCSRRHLC